MADKLLAEVPHALLGVGVVGPELQLERRPGDGAGAGLFQVAHPVGEPEVDVQGHGALLDGPHGPQVDRHRVPGDLVEELLSQSNRRFP